MSFYPGKVIITGEHSVVYGHKALLSALSLGVTCDAESGLELVNHAIADPYLKHILQLCSRELEVRDIETTLVLKITSTLPAKSGLGSSAAVAAAVITAVFEYYGRHLSSAKLYPLVLEAEQYVHGRSSGADPSIVVHGGSLLFQQGVATPLESDFLAKQTFALVDSGAATESTGEMVAVVAHHPEREALIVAIGAVSEAIVSQLQQGKYPVSLIRENHLLLARLGVVGAAAQDIIEQLWRMGIVAKITGAGGKTSGSGFILAWHEDSVFLREQVNRLGVSTIITQLGNNRGKHNEN